MEKAKCKEKVYPNDRWGSFHPHQCMKNAIKDGYCKIHHPDSIKEQQEKAEIKYEAKRKQSPIYRLQKANKKIEKLITELWGLLELLPTCECDNTHENVDTVCRMCSARKTIAKIKGE